MKQYKKLTYIFMIFFLIGGCKNSEKKIIEKENSLEIIVSCEEDSNLEQYINDGWKIKKNTQNKKFVHGKQSLPRRIVI